MKMREFQDEVGRWAVECFGEKVLMDPRLRALRFLEEAFELAQAGGLSSADAERVMEYVYDRPRGVIDQEVGGVAVTLAAFCTAYGLDLDYCAVHELRNILLRMPEIRKKQETKPT